MSFISPVEKISVNLLFIRKLKHNLSDYAGIKTKIITLPIISYYYIIKNDQRSRSLNKVNPHWEFRGGKDFNPYYICR